MTFYRTVHKKMITYCKLKIYACCRKLNVFDTVSRSKKHEKRGRLQRNTGAVTLGLGC